MLRSTPWEKKQATYEAIMGSGMNCSIAADATRAAAGKA